MQRLSPLLSDLYYFEPRGLGQGQGVYYEGIDVVDELFQEHQGQEVQWWEKEEEAEDEDEGYASESSVASSSTLCADEDDDPYQAWAGFCGRAGAESCRLHTLS